MRPNGIFDVQPTHATPLGHGAAGQRRRMLAQRFDLQSRFSEVTPQPGSEFGSSEGPRGHGKTPPPSIPPSPPMRASKNKFAVERRGGDERGVICSNNTERTLQQLAQA